MNKIVAFVKQRKIISAVTIIILIAGGYYGYNKSQSSITAVQYKTAAVEKGTLTTSISGSGNMIVDNIANIDPTITGTVTNLAVSVGDQVRKGQLLFEIKNDDLSLNVTRAHSSYLQSLASLETAKANKKEAKENYEDASSSDESTMEKKLEAAEISVTVAEENIKSALASYNNEKSNYADRKVTSPIDGTVNEINIKNGDDLSRLSSSSDSSAPIIIGDLNTLKAQVEINEVDIANVAIGQKASLTLNAIDGLSLTGKVEKVDSIGALSSGVVSYNVIISLDSLDPRIKSEMSVSAAIITDVKQDVVLVPNSAIKTQNGNTYVQILNGQTPENKTVKVGLANDVQTEILSGLNVGDNVVTQTVNSNTTTASATSSSGLRIPGLGGGRPD
jgi:macrolide-specific efflux system membrane fusion protein